MGGDLVHNLDQSRRIVELRRGVQVVYTGKEETLFVYQVNVIVSPAFWLFQTLLAIVQAFSCYFSGREASQRLAIMFGESGRFFYILVGWLVLIFVKSPRSLLSRFIGHVPSVTICQSTGLFGRIGERGGSGGRGVALRSS